MGFDAFLKISTIPGESTDSAHADWIEVLQYAHGVYQPSTGSVSSGGARSAERSDHEHFSVVHALDKASPKLFLACCKGEHIPEVTIELCRNTGNKQPYMKYTLTDVLISSVRPTGTAKGTETLPLEEVKFSYGKLEQTYTQTDHQTGAAKGEVKAYWNLVDNTGG
jgi:type VI secretion system secreted protein Hcp